MDKFISVDESDCASPFDTRADKFTLYQAAMLWTGRPAEAPFPFPADEDNERRNWLKACEKTDVENGKPLGTWSVFCQLEKAVEEKALPANMAFDRNGNHAPIRTVVRKSDLRQFAEKQWGELPDFLRDKDSESVAIGREAETASSGTCEQVEKALNLGMATGDIAAAFDGVYWNYGQWKSNLADCPNWLRDARISRGRQGKGKAGSSRWNPLELALCILQKNESLKTKLNSAFTSKEKLSDWLPAWKEYIATEAEYFK